MIYVLYTTISNEKYKKLSDSAKVTYAILNDRVSLSIKNNWIDDNGDIYFIFINESLQNILDKSKNTITKIKKELQEVGLLEQIRTGFNRPNKLYLHDIETNISVEKMNRLDDTIVVKYQKYITIKRKNKHKMQLDYLFKTLMIK